MAGDLALALEVAERHAADLFEQGKIDTLTRWAQEFHVEQYPNSEIRLLLATSLLDKGALAEADNLLLGLFGDTAEGANKRTLARAAVTLGISAYTRGQNSISEEWFSKAQECNKRDKSKGIAIDCYRFLALLRSRAGKYEEALEYAERAVSLLDGSTRAYYSGLALSTLMTVQVSAGKLVAARDTGVRAVAAVTSLGANLLSAIALNNLATIEHAGGEYEDALEHYAGSLEKAKLAGSDRYQAQVYLGQADLFNDIGLIRQAAELYGEAIQILTRTQNIEWATYVCIQTSVLHRRNGGVQPAQEWLKRGMEIDSANSDSSRMLVQLAALELSVSPENAIQTLDRVLIGSRGSQADAVLAHYFQAKAHLSSGKLDSARDCLKIALQRAGTSDLLQDVSSELRADKEVFRFAQSEFRSLTTWERIEAQIDTMNAVGAYYGRKSSDEPSVSRPIQIKALGRGRILLKGQEPTGLKPQVREFLFYLVDQGGAERERLAQTFWPNFGPGRQTANIHMAVYSLRNAFGKEFISLDGVVYSIAAGVQVAYDVQEFERTARLAQDLPVGDPRRLFAFTEAIRQYGGPYLLEFRI